MEWDEWALVTKVHPYTKTRRREGKEDVSRLFLMDMVISGPPTSY